MLIELYRVYNQIGTILKKRGEIKMKKFLMVLLVFSLLYISVGMGAEAERVYSPDGKGYRFEQDGWIYIHIEGDPSERGFQHGYLVADQLKEIRKSLEYLTYWDSGMKWDFFVDKAKEMWEPHIDKELKAELQGIAAGASYAGVHFSWEEIMAWNGYEELMGYWWPNELEKTYNKINYGAVSKCS